MIEFSSNECLHLLGERATGAMAHFFGPLAAFSVFQWNTLLAGVQPASSSRLARKPKKCTLAPVQLLFLG
jgi:hypothetical protein